MDSVFTSIHWESSDLPLIADCWIGQRMDDDEVVVPEEYVEGQHDDEPVLELKTKKPKKKEWIHNPAEEI